MADAISEWICRDCMLISGINCFTSVLSGFAVFSVLGFMAKQQGVSIDHVAESGMCTTPTRVYHVLF